MKILTQKAESEWGKHINTVLYRLRNKNVVPRNERIARAQCRQIVERNLFLEPREPPVVYQPGDLVLVRNFTITSNFGQTWF